MPIPIDKTIRQFARAVTADRFAGDELAAAVVAEVASHENGAAEPASARAAMFRRFIAKWRTLADPSSPPKPFSNAEFVHSLGSLPGEGRLVLLLSDVCGLTRPEIEYALAPMTNSVEENLNAERGAIRAGKYGGRAVIIEDEPLIAADLRDVLEGIGVNVVAMARTAEQGARETLLKTPDIVLADFNLDGQKTGVDSVLEFQSQHTCPVIFITGYPDAVLTGSQIEPDFVIAKPYSPEAVQAAVAHCLDTARLTVIDADLAGDQ